MTTHQPDAQPDYLTEVGQISSALSLAHLRLTNLMQDFPIGPEGQRPDEWHDCYRASQAVHLGNQLLGVARDNELARRAPVPYLPAEYMEQASALIAAAIMDGDPVIVTDES